MLLPFSETTESRSASPNGIETPHSKIITPFNENIGLETPPPSILGDAITNPFNENIGLESPPPSILGDAITNPFNENIGLETPPPSILTDAPIHQLKILSSCKPAINSESLDLYAWLRHNSSPPEHVIKCIFRQIVDAVDYMHKAGICHLDIKDENVIINPYTLETKIIDFGSSDFIPLKRKNFFVKFRGTCSYAPPEILLNESFDGPAVDVWALGILLHVLCFSTTPFRSESDIMHGRLCTEGSGHGSMDIIRYLLISDPIIRPTAGDVLKHDWLN
jgi:hypothetical protein